MLEQRQEKVLVQERRNLLDVVKLSHPESERGKQAVRAQSGRQSTARLEDRMRQRS
jgi:hypothetical protein